MARRTAILTLVGNTEGGAGPGHSAIVVDRKVYSFENAGDWFSLPWREESGWIVMETSKYVARNGWRPIIVQELDQAKVDANRVLKYIKSSIGSDDDYLSSGVCSSQVANAVDKGTIKTFNPKGIDTPYKVFKLAKDRGLATSTYLIWTAPTNNSAQTKLNTDYASVNRSGNSVLAW